MNDPDKAKLPDSPSPSRSEQSPALCKKERKEPKYDLSSIILATILAAFISVLMNHPFDCFRVENSREYKLYQQALKEYHVYETTHGQRPKGLEYLSPELRALVDKSGSCLVSRDDGRELVFLTYSPGWKEHRPGAAEYLKRRLLTTPHIVMAVIPEPRNSNSDGNPATGK